MIELLKKINIFAKPQPKDLAKTELDEAERELLKAQSALEYTKAMVAYRSDQIRRLNSYLEVTQ